MAKSTISSGSRSVRLDKAVDQAMNKAVDPVSTKTVDPVAQAELVAVKNTLALYGVAKKNALKPNLIESIFDYIMPQMRNPDILLPDNQSKILDKISRQMGDVNPKDKALRSAKAVVMGEILRLSLVRKNINSLVQG